MIRKLALKLIRKVSPVQCAKLLGVRVGKECRLIDVEFSTEPYLVQLGDRVSATKTRFETHDGAVWLFRKDEPSIDFVSNITIGNNVYIGYDCIVLPGTKIKDNVIIGAKSVVKGVYESGYVYAGVPAKKICSVNAYYEKNKSNFEHTKNMSKKEKKCFYLRKYSVQ